YRGLPARRGSGDSGRPRLGRDRRPVERGAPEAGRHPPGDPWPCLPDRRHHAGRPHPVAGPCAPPAAPAQRLIPVAALRIDGPDDLRRVFGLTAPTVARLQVYVDLLGQWQRRINLVGPSTMDAVWLRHMADGAQLLALG